MYAPRKIVFPFFIVLFSGTFIAMLFLVFLNQALVVGDDASVSLAGQNVVLKMKVTNVSNHVIDKISIMVRNGSAENTYPLRGDSYLDANSSSLAPGETFDFIKAWPLSDSLIYDIYVSAPFNRQIHLVAPLKEETVNPVDAKIYQLPSSMILNKSYTYSARLCNISGTDLPEVIFYESAEQGVFEEKLFDQARSVKLDSTECKTIYSTLTPIKVGNISVAFHYKVGDLDRSVSQEINVTAN